MNRSSLAGGRLSAALLMLASAATLLAALFFQYVVGLAPCVLCVWQRWPYVAVLVLGVVALAGGPRLRAAMLALMGATFLVGAGIALFHIGVEQHWWAGTSGCGVTATADSLEALRAQVLNAPVVRCDEVPWSLFGLSMAGYNFIISLVLAAAALTAARLALRG